MLVEFRVKNYKSIKDEQIFSMVYPYKKPSKDKERNIFETGFNYAPYLTDIAAIYGPNASGKTKLLEAMKFMQDFIIASSKNKISFGDKISDNLNYTPFLFSKDSENAPSEFEIVFIYGDYLYQYGFVIDEEKIHEEWLYEIPKKGKKQEAQEWFHRELDDFEIKKEIKGAKEQWMEEVKDNQLFLGFVMDKNSKEFQEPFNWLKDGLIIILNPDNLPISITSRRILEKEENKDVVVQFISGIDSSIVDITARSEKPKLDKKSLKVLEIFKEDNPDKEIDLDDLRVINVKGIHKKDDGSLIEIDFAEESAGTNRLFNFAALILDSLNGGRSLIIDELSNSLHTELMKNVIKLFSSKKTNHGEGQLIFTTHDVNAMDFLNKDQIWFTEKDYLGATELKSLIEFKGERSEYSFSKRYLTGRYGALPILEGLFDETE